MGYDMGGVGQVLKRDLHRRSCWTGRDLRPPPPFRERPLRSVPLLSPIPTSLGRDTILSPPKGLAGASSALTQDSSKGG